MSPDERLTTARKSVCAYAENLKVKQEYRMKEVEKLCSNPDQRGTSK